MKKDYQTRLREFEAEKRLLDYQDLSPKDYQQEIRKLAAKYGI